MPISEVGHVDVVADAGAVGRRVVRPEHAQVRPDPERHLLDVGHQVVRDADGVLADAPRRVRAHGVEVPQQDHAPAVLGLGDVRENVLDHQLGAAVGGHGAARVGLVERGALRLAVDGAGGGEDHLLFWGGGGGGFWKKRRTKLLDKVSEKEAKKRDKKKL